LGDKLIFHQSKHLISIVCAFVILFPAIASGVSVPNNSPYGDYNTDESGNVYMYINVIGHVKAPGTFLIYEGTNLLTILSAAGGPLPGAKLNNITIYRDGDSMIRLDLDKYLDTGKKLDINFKPNDTIYVKQTLGSFLLSNTTILNSILSMINIYFTIDQAN